MNVLSILPKAIGAVTSGLVLYDAHKSGARNARMSAKRSIASDMVDNYVHTLDVDKVSNLQVNTKKSWFKFCMDNSLSENLHTVGGYISGFFSSVVDDIVPVALAVGSFIPGKKALSGTTGKMVRKTPIVGMACAAGLLLYSLNHMFFNVMSIGKKNYLNNNN